MDNSSRVDPITFEVIKNSLEHICRQMGTVLRKTSYSPILYDMVDFSNALLDGQGELIGQAENCPAHLGAMHFSTKAAVNEIGLDNLNDGDIIISNNPFKGGTHVPDITFIMPIFYQGEATGFVCSRLQPGTLDGSRWCCGGAVGKQPAPGGRWIGDRSHQNLRQRETG
jgi:N-methylhydantoinase B/oxoprolinase/acetone carboxylase alpha subunit